MKFEDAPIYVTANPMTRVYGITPDKRCGDCAYLVYHQRMGGRLKRWYKCTKRGFTHGAGTDHRLSWPACGLFEAHGIVPPASSGSASERGALREAHLQVNNQETPE